MGDRYGMHHRSSRRTKTPTFYDDHTEDYSYQDKVSARRKKRSDSSDWDDSGIAAKSTYDESRDDTSYGYRSRESDILKPPRMSSTVSSWYSSLSEDRNTLDSVGMKNTLGQAKQYLANPDRSEGKVRLKKRLLKELDAYRNELKAQLLLFNDNFMERHGRPPKRQEKEPIRHLYEVYHSFKKEIQKLREEDDEEFSHPDIAPCQVEEKQVIQVQLQNPPPSTKKGSMFGKKSRSKSPSPLKKRPSTEARERPSNVREKNAVSSPKPKRSSSPLSFFGSTSSYDGDRKTSKPIKQPQPKRAPSPNRLFKKKSNNSKEKSSDMIRGGKQEVERAISPTHSRRAPSPRLFRPPSFDCDQDLSKRAPSPTPSMRSRRAPSPKPFLGEPSHFNESERNQIAKTAVSPTNSRRSANSFFGRGKEQKMIVSTVSPKRAASPTSKFFERMKNGGRSSQEVKRVSSPTHSTRSATPTKFLGRRANDGKKQPHGKTDDLNLNTNAFDDNEGVKPNASKDAVEKAQTFGSVSEEGRDEIQFTNTRDSGKQRLRYSSPKKLRNKKSSNDNGEDPDWCDVPKKNSRSAVQKSNKDRNATLDWEVEVQTDDPKNTLVERVPMRMCMKQSDEMVGGGCMGLEALVPKLLGMDGDGGTGEPGDEMARYTAAKKVASKLMDEIKKESARLGVPESKLLAAIQDGGGSFDRPVSPRRVKNNGGDMRAIQENSARRTRSRSRQKSPFVESFGTDWQPAISPLKIHEIVINETKSVGDVSSVTGIFN